MRKPLIFLTSALVFVGVAAASTTIRDYIIKNSQIIASAISGSTIANSNITGGSISGAAISGGTVSGAGISQGAIFSTNMSISSITTTNISSSNVTASSIDSSDIGQTTPAKVNATEYKLNGVPLSFIPDYHPNSPGRSAGVEYTNAGNGMIVSGSLLTTGSGTGNVSCNIGPSSIVYAAWRNQATATVSNGSAGFICPVPAGWHYRIDHTGAVTASVEAWVESPF